MTKTKGSYPNNKTYQGCDLKIQTYHPVIRGVGVRGTLTIFDNFISFVQHAKTSHARNKVVFRSRFFSARVTKDNGFSITCHVTAEEISTERVRKKVVQQFIKMMSTLQSVIEIN